MRQAGPTLGKMFYLLSYRLGEEEKGRRVVTACHFSFTLSCQLSSSKLVAKARNETLFITQKLFLFLCVCVVSQFDLSITKQNYLFVRCQSLSHIPNTSLRCSNQPLWKLNLMTGVNTTKQQTGEIKNTIKRVI